MVGINKLDRDEGTLARWLKDADAVDRMRGIEAKVQAKMTWPKPFWEEQ